MNIKIEKDVLDYLSKKRKNAITLSIHKSGGGCCPTIEVADVELIKPNDEDMNKYNCITQDGLDVYIVKTAIVLTPVLKFVLEKSMLSKHIVPLGLALKKH